jgi:hypothetical protein
LNQLQPYEQTIAEKLEQRLIPDMADLIWARIEEQLDTDMPTNNGPDQAPPASPSSGLTKGLGFFMIFTAIVVIFLLVRKPSTAPEQTQPSLAPAAPAGIVDSTGTPPDIPKMDQPIKKGNTPQSGTNLNSSDSASNIPFLNEQDNTIIPIDTTTKSPPLLLPPALDSAIRPPVQVPPQTKKQKGVRLTNPDYRIVPKRNDSTGK